MSDQRSVESSSTRPEKFEPAQRGELAGELRQEAFDSLVDRPDAQAIFSDRFGVLGAIESTGRFNGVEGKLTRLEDKWHVSVRAEFSYPAKHRSKKHHEVIDLVIPSPATTEYSSPLIGSLKYTVNSELGEVSFSDDPNAYIEISKALSERFSPRPAPPVKLPK